MSLRLFLVSAILLISAVATAQEQRRRVSGFETFVVVDPATDKEGQPGMRIDSVPNTGDTQISGEWTAQGHYSTA